jgi:hypothetical protein
MSGPTHGAPPPLFLSESRRSGIHGTKPCHFPELLEVPLFQQKVEDYGTILLTTKIDRVAILSVRPVRLVSQTGQIGPLGKFIWSF